MHRKVSLVLLVLFVLGGTMSAPADAKSPFKFPADMQQLMPARAELMMVFQSLAAVDGQLAQIMPPESGPEATELLSELVDREFGEFPAAIDPDHPLAIMMNLPDPMGGLPMQLVAILPLADPSLSLADDTSDFFLARSGAYVSLSTVADWPGNDGPPDWLDEVPADLLHLRVDLATVIARNRPLLEMGLGSLAMSAARADTSGAVAPGLTVDEAAALGNLAQAILNSLHTFGMGLAVDGEHLTFSMDWRMQPGSPLSPGPQPHFKRALQTAGILPHDGGFVSALAVDQSAQIDLWTQYYQATILKQMAAMAPESAARLQAWFDEYLAAYDLYFQPMAAVVNVRDDALLIQSALQTEDPRAALDQVASLLNKMSDVGMGWTVQEHAPYRLEGVDVRSWDLAFDYNAMAQGLYPPQTYPSGPQPQMQQMNLIMSRVLSEVHMTAAGEYLLVSSGADETAFKDMIKRAKKGKSRDQKALVAATRRIGSQAQVVSTGDLGVFVAWFTSLMAAMDHTEPVFDWPLEQPLSFTEFLTIGGDSYGFGMQMEKADLRTLWSFLADMEDQE